ncbi:mevalonate kinase [Polyangium fumosum]|uniref:phosphomevalonate kinase n=1 Tax=Polyangium fumosum TaxID=889272 RepID=A0A4U1J9H3_9BACT|nr:hypothetical protein [Polyangium fumosum]TKD03278.1 hypothetical protein E8A74_26445 [Polyangium fumosum]
MITRAPGKIVVSGAYAVLEGAPALVAAVDRYVMADASRTSEFVTEEVRAAIDAGILHHAPAFDASALRAPMPDGTTRKLGLGSSAAITVASIGAVLAATIEDEAALQRAVFPLALAAHRKAQPRGSGIDVASSVFGGIVACRLAPEGALDVVPFTLPEGVVLEVFACPTAASTGALVEKVQGLRATDPATYRHLLDEITDGAQAALEAQDAAGFVQAITAQLDALAELGRAAGAPIVVDDVADLRPFARAEGASFGPSGAGGGDIALWIGRTPSSAAFRARAAARKLEPLDTRIGPPGLSVG